ncbi:uncharacterized protein N7443_008914 [Penicillium atrosanguineum]|uniref:uncharacterized protein n=1 Tax=Penicillium atrosanguineum TaxID=1132637 RepID=UPI00239D48EA|nr:uncharacterized protein N7443_008914 [Penicillium atrosanguineum]KAJ5292961.1 hypothetical protein N7443_008914 [Penicillium atrosanguineum]
MPGVPTGRACDACRKQKKKCDEQQPTCSRCARLKVKCIGSGKQRFKFQEEKRFSPPRPPQANVKSESISFNSVITKPIQHIYMHVPLGSLLPSPSNELTNLTATFIRTIKRSTDLRYNMWWSFGTFLDDVPRRLGSNEALDRAVDAVSTAHGDFCTRREASTDALAKYSQALHTLRVYLDDQFHAQSSNTLCAVMILLICQVFLGPSTQCWSGHAEGAAAILKARKSLGPRDDFEKKLFLSMRGTVLFEGVFNDRINLTPEEWTDLVKSDLDSNTPEGQMMICLSQAPDLMRRGREALQTGSDTTSVSDEIWAIYQNCKTELRSLQLRASENIITELDISQIPAGKQALVRTFMYAHYERTYGIGLTISLFFNCLLSGLGAHDGASLFDAHFLAEEVLALADRSAIWRPIGTGYLIIGFSAAWAAATDPLIRARLLVAINEYGSDMRMRDSNFLINEVQWTAERLRLGTPLEKEKYLHGVREYIQT